MTSDSPEGAQVETHGRRTAPGEMRPRIFYMIVAVVLIADQLSKAWVQRTLAYEESRDVIGKAFTLTLTHNTGGAWGLLPQGNPIFIIFAAVAAVVLLVAYHRVARTDAMVGGAFALALGGAFGNLLDRVRYGYVVDFFDARIIRWPIFNIADSAISVSIVLLLLHFVRSARSESTHSEAPEAAERASVSSES